MYSLFIDTHSSLITVALTNGKVVYKKERESNLSHSKLLLPMIKELMNEKKVDFKHLEEIIVVNGPGSFTGIRIGLSVAKTIAYALNIKIKTISSLTVYLVSSNLDNKIAVIKENKGYYISAFDINNKNVLEEKYVTDINEYKDRYNIIKNEINILNVYNYMKTVNNINPHLVKANYIKKIEALK